MRRLLLSLALVVGLLEADRARAEGPPVLAVFGIEDTRPPKQRLRAADLTGLTDYLATKISSAGMFQIVANTDIKTALSQKKAESYKACYDSACQIEIGKEVAAEKSLATKILLLGKKCDVASTLYDLKRATSERSTDEEGGCDIDSIREALKKIAGRLAEGEAARLAEKKAAEEKKLAEEKAAQKEAEAKAERERQARIQAEEEARAARERLEAERRRAEDERRAKEKEAMASPVGRWRHVLFEMPGTKSEEQYTIDPSHTIAHVSIVNGVMQECSWCRTDFSQISIYGAHVGFVVAFYNNGSLVSQFRLTLEVTNDGRTLEGTQENLLNGARGPVRFERQP